MGTAEEAGSAIECSHLLPLNREFTAQNFSLQAAAPMAYKYFSRSKRQRDSRGAHGPASLRHTRETIC
jgi:hypothetical protein